MNKTGKIAILQIMILLIGIIAFAGLIDAGDDDEGTGVGTVAAGVGAVGGGGEDNTNTPNPTPWYTSFFGFNEAEGIENAQENPLNSGNRMDGLVSAASWGVAAYYATRLLGPTLGLEEDEVDAASRALGWGVFAGRSIMNTMTARGAEHAAATGFWIGALITWVVYTHLYRETSYKIITFNSYIWDAPVGGEDCHKCNEQEFPCSIYQCKSLGQACELLNDEDTGEQFCAWVHKNDVKAPEIQTWDEPLLHGYKYTPDIAISPPNSGVKIENTQTTDKCAKAFTPLSFGIILDEPGKCKIDYERKNFDAMQFFFGGNPLYNYNHTQIMSLPGLDNAAAENLTLQNDGDFELYVKCMDANGNQNENDFVFKFCVQKGPDTTAPYIVDTSIINGMPVAFGQDSLPLIVYLNEPAECKWSHDDKSYDNMINEMACAKKIKDYTEVNAQIVYECRTNLTGIQNKKENKFYFRCKDQPMLNGTDREGDRNENSQSLPSPEGFVIIGTQPLVIDEAGPGGLIKDSAEAVKATLTARTSAGYDEGISTCYYREPDEDEKEYVEFRNTNSYTHSTDLYLPSGEYEYVIKCEDLGGNYDRWQINFTTESDSNPPEIARVYKAENLLTVTTNENASCVYDTLSCIYEFDNGIPLTTGSNQKMHVTDWNTKTRFYIKCRDEFGNEPGPDECSIIVRPIE